MKSYLQRLALGVMQPVQSIHPMVGSVFSPPPDTETKFVSSLAGPDYEYRQENATNVSSVEQRQFQPTSRAQESNSLTEPQPGYRPLMPELAALPIGNQSRPATPHAENPPSDRGETVSSSSFANGAGTESSRPADSQRDEKTQNVTVRHVYAPIVSGSLVRPGNPELSKQNTNPFAGDARQKMQGMPRHAAAAAREPDEIQIHIGRIEVTAVPQAPAPTATKPLRKGLNLEEYLRRSARRV